MNLLEDLFGFEFKKKTPVKEQNTPSFVQKETDDGAVVVAAGGAYGTYVDLDGTVRTEAELVTKYREMALQPECDSAIDEIINESMSIDEETIVNINLDNVKTSDNIKKNIREEFQNCLKLIEFNKHAYDIYRRWYIDGRLYYHIIIDEKNTKDGIKELRYIDPRKIRKVREIQRKKITTGSGAAGLGDAALTKTINEYYIFNDKGFNYGNKIVGPTTAGLKIAKDSILHIVSGLTDNQGTMVLSYLHKGIKALNQLRTLEDALVIYRLARAPERRIWYIDVGNLPKMKAEQYVRDIMVKHKNRLIYDANSGEVRDDRRFMCLSLDTKIPLLDGRTLELHELIKEYEEGKTNWVYSCDPITGKFVPGPISWAGITKRNSEVVKVTLDNGKSVICTPDHKFPVWNKGFVEAKDLVGESIIPGYRRQKKIAQNSNLYEQIYKNDTKTWEFTHREISNWKKSLNINEEFTYEDYDEPKTIIHHKDINRYNNNPDNLVMMGYKDHIKYHANINNARWNGVDNLLSRNKLSDSQKIVYNQEIYTIVEYTAKLGMTSKQAIEYINNNINIEMWNNLNKDKKIKIRDNLNVFTNKDLVRVCKELGYDTWISYKKLKRTNKKSRSLYKKGSYELKQLLSEMKKNKVTSCKSWKIISPDKEEIIIENLNEFCRNNNLNRSNIKGKFGSKGYFAEPLRNHKAVSVEWLDEKIDVGCITIDLDETYHSNHTYLLDIGVYTKNTMLEDYWLPRREGGRGTEVSTLPGGQTLGQMDDVLYFQKKFLQCLNVPVSRLNSDALFSIGRATEITRDELKFARFVIRLRSRFSTLFTKLLEKQLVLKGVMSLEEYNNLVSDIKFDYSKDNYFTELKDAEISEARVNLARNFQDMVGKYYSHKWVRKNILKQSDDAIEVMDEDINEELGSNNPRWFNPMIAQNEQMMQPQQAGPTGPTDMPSDGAPAQASPGLDSTQSSENDKIRDKMEQIRQAQVIVDQMKKKKGNRSMQDESKYKAAVQIIAKNKQFLSKMGQPVTNK